jgi:hypothetical protein
MRLADKKPFAEMLQATYTELYQREPLSRIALQLWWGAFADIDIAAFSAALSGWVTRAGRGQHPPKPADILKLIGGSIEDRAILAWRKAEAACARVGQYHSVCFDDPMINAAIEQMGGWPKLCAGPEADLQWRERDFKALYVALTESGAEHPAHLPGAFEIQNAANGYVRPVTPYLLGDAGRAQAVIDGGRSNGVPALRITLSPTNPLSITGPEAKA